MEEPASHSTDHDCIIRGQIGKKNVGYHNLSRSVKALRGEEGTIDSDFKMK